MICLIHFLVWIQSACAFWSIGAFEPTYGLWRLLYTDNDAIPASYCDLMISPCTNIHRANVRVRYMVEKYSIVVEKTSLSAIELKCVSTSSPIRTHLSFLESMEHTLGEFKILKSQQTIKSVFFLGLPYVIREYTSTLPSNLLVRWKHDKDLGRLYISYGNYTYVFEKKCGEDGGPFSASQTSVIALNLLIVSQILSTLIQKIIDRIEHF